MDVSVKEEPQFDTLEFLEESVQCCLLCPDVKSILESLANHVRKFHHDGKYCRCFEWVFMKFGGFRW